MHKAAALFFALPLLAHAAEPKVTGTLITADQGPNNLAMIDLATGKQVGTLSEDGLVKVHELVMLPDGKTLIAPIYGDSGVGKPGTDGSKVLVYDVAARKVIHTIDLGKPLRPHQPTYDAKRNVVYVTTELDQAMTAIDAKTFKVLYEIPTGQPESHMFALSHDGRRGYTANVGPGTVSVLDMDAHKTLAVIPVAKHLQRISISNDDKTVFVSDTETHRLAAIDTGTNQVRQWIDLPASGFGSRPTADGKWLAICLPDANKVGVIDLATMKLVKTVDVAGKPQEILYSPDGSRAWASSFGEPKVAEIDTKTWTLTRELPGTDRNDGMAYSPLQ